MVRGEGVQRFGVNMVVIIDRLVVSHNKSHIIQKGAIATTVFNLFTAHTSISTVKQFCCLQITASVLLVYSFVKAYVLGNHLIALTCR